MHPYMGICIRIRYREREREGGTEREGEREGGRERERRAHSQQAQPCPARSLLDVLPALLRSLYCSVSVFVTANFQTKNL